MAPKQLITLRLLLDHPNGLYGSELVHRSEGKLNRGTVYVLLDRLVEEGFVREDPVPPSPTHQMTRVRHIITAQGKAAYHAFLQEQGLQMVPFATSGIA
jgi:DNA-binding PadR family transcriptional regulator